MKALIMVAAWCADQAPITALCLTVLVVLDPVGAWWR